MLTRKEVLVQAVTHVMNIPKRILDQSCVAHFYDGQNDVVFDVVLPVGLDDAQEYMDENYFEAAPPKCVFASVPRSFETSLTGVEDFKTIIKVLIDNVLESEALYESKPLSERLPPVVNLVYDDRPPAKEDVLVQSIIHVMGVSERIFDQSCLAHFYDRQNDVVFDVVLPVGLDDAQKYMNTHYFEADTPQGVFASIPRSFNTSLTGVEDFRTVIKSLVESALEAEALDEQKTQSDMSMA